MAGLIAAQRQPGGDIACMPMRIDAAFARKTIVRQQVEPRRAVERRRGRGRARVGGQPRVIISAMFTVPLHRLALYHPVLKNR